MFQAYGLYGHIQANRIRSALLLAGFVVLLHVLLGTALVAAGASALNQWLERPSDALMKRTENRPLPAGRLQPLEAAAFGAGLGLVGLVYLAVALPNPLAALVAAFTFASYVFIYTPLKRVTSLNTLIGAVPGALPPLIGWAAVRGSLDGPAVALFAILFFGGWQPGFPVDFMKNWPETLQSFLLFLVFFAKTIFMFFLFAMVKAIVPRYRYDQLMRLGWKIFLPTSLIAVMLVAGYRVFTGHPA